MWRPEGREFEGYTLRWQEQGKSIEKDSKDYEELFEKE